MRIVRALMGMHARTELRVRACVRACVCARVQRGEGFCSIETDRDGSRRIEIAFEIAIAI